jgi:hypothetical protein
VPRAGGDGTVADEIGPIDYPDSYADEQHPQRPRFIDDTRTVVRDPADPNNPDLFEWYCLDCSFRPWADTGDASTAYVTFAHADGSTEKVAAHEQGDRWVADRPLAAGERVYVAPGDVCDRYGNYNGAAYAPAGQTAPADARGMTCA